MKERPILFTGPMVRAILEGRKTVTRRVMKPQPDFLGSMVDPNTPFKTLDAGLHARITCPYGEPGDRLWVRETWHVGKPHDKTAPADILAPLLAEGRGITVLYTAGGWQSVGPAGREEPIYPDDQPLPDWAGKGRPSIHMPRWACRILLEITAVRVELLQDISEDQARAEGITDGGCSSCGNHEPCGCECPAPSAVDSFVHLWRSTGGNWESNPWVWVVEFKRVTP
ncbi:hypothetical protein V4238_001364 [Pseudomonas aeruginosa]|uniref:hypothetical protein n=1 Tax=Pseudomonas aeruginosa TaxID=287 RepID=UPI00071B0FF9|nr:hypothetical protein [Pseudomonas aeruginosa]EIU5457523.1 hypothetical protein [Pseudomonas aeruginosa]EKY0496508.1 hypothetical protein [Pseudomonas aeruginosa]ELZ3614579.1 hypothetical protein [Pseudomonas aeruginosa]KSM05695.1 hypothetical protein APA60_08335 [Pseudomonas aeruginosa]MCI3214055.1 hypothetical protein [Pseudomonas aeruginosa]